MFFLRIVPAVLMAVVVVLGFPVTNKERSSGLAEGFSAHASLQGHESRYYGNALNRQKNSEGHVPNTASRYSNDVFQDRRNKVGHRAHAQAVEQIRREILNEYLYGRALEHVKFQGQLASASQEHKDHIESLVRAHHAALPEGHHHKEATQAYVFKDFHHSPGEDKSGPQHVTLRFFKGSKKSKNELTPAAHVYE